MVIAARLCIKVDCLDVLALVLELASEVVGCSTVTRAGDNLCSLVEVSLLSVVKIMRKLEQFNWKWMSEC